MILINFTITTVYSKTPPTRIVFYRRPLPFRSKRLTTFVFEYYSSVYLKITYTLRSAKNGSVMSLTARYPYRVIKRKARDKRAIALGAFTVYAYKIGNAVKCDHHSLCSSSCTAITLRAAGSPCIAVIAITARARDGSKNVGINNVFCLKSKQKRGDFTRHKNACNRFRSIDSPM